MKTTPPHFELYQAVTLHWNDRAFQTRIVKRLYDPDEGLWSYQVKGSPQLFSVSVLEARK